MKKTIISICLFCMFSIGQFISYGDSSKSVTPSVNSSVTPSVESNSSPAQIWNLKDADIKAVIETVSVITGKTFIVDPKISGNVTLVSQHPMTSDEMYQAFLSMLEALNYVAIPTSAGVKILPAASASGIPMASKDGNMNSLTPVVQVIPLHHMSAIQLVSSLRKMVPKWGSVNAYTATNSLIVTGSATSIKQILEVVNQMEKNSTKKAIVVPLEYASAKNTKEVLSALMTSAQSKGQSTTVALAADEQSNSILLSGNIAEVMQAKQLLATIDKPESMQASMSVIPLHYLNAVDIQPVLANIANGSSQLVTGDVPTAADFSSQSISSDGTSSSGSSSSSSSSRQSNTVSSMGSSSQGMSSSGDDSFSNSTSIQAIVATNSIVIHAPKSLMTALTSILKKLDKRPNQVLVQAVVAKIDQKVLNEMGVQWSLMSGDDSSATSVNGQDGTYNMIATGQMGLMSGTNIQALVTALTSETSTDLLSTPSIMVLDNQMASISDGTNIGVVNTTYDGDNNDSDYYPSNSIERMNVDLSLQVIPHVIEENNMIKMDIKQIDDSINEDTASYTTSEENPELDTSEIDTTVMVRSGDILVLGGLINNDNEYKTERVPVLGSIPIIGSLFKYKYKKHDKKNLVVFIRPITIKNDNSATVESMRHLKYLNELQQNLGSDNQQVLQQSFSPSAGQASAIRGALQLPAPQETAPQLHNG